MVENSLFGHLASKFTAHPEDIATEALDYILNSFYAKKSLIKLLTKAHSNLSRDITFETQDHENNTRPDLVGKDNKNRPVVILEAKFWAGLTDNQPVKYLYRLPNDIGGILAFICPSLRLHTLWPELKRRCEESANKILNEKEVAPEYHYAKLQSNCVLAIFTWRYLLKDMLENEEIKQDSKTSNDIHQLLGLCEHIDSKEFLPVRSEELSPQFGRRCVDFSQLVDKVAKEAVAQGICRKERLKPTGGIGYYNRYLYMHKVGISLRFDARLWASLRETPLWIQVGFKSDNRALIKEALAELQSIDPPGVIAYKGELVIPLYIPTNCEEKDVIDSLIKQLSKISNLLEKCR
jgi:hypothetical protein